MHKRYQLADLIGQGGMGLIYRAYDRLTGVWVALKQLHLDEEEWLQPQTRAALAAEFRLLATLRHPNIVAVLDYGFLQQTAFYTMELLATPLDLVTAAHALPVAERIDLLAQLLQALEYLRRHQVVHRDLKPGNVLVRLGQVQLVDFGLAMFEGQTSEWGGTPFYMAPEVLQNQPATHASDLFAVGVLAYEVLAGERPFREETFDALVQATCTTPPDYTLVAGPPALRTVLARLLAPIPTNRYATAGEALTALIAASGQTVPPAIQAAHLSFIQAAQFVGRETEHAQLVQALNYALAGQGSSWLIGGESGVGKTRLLEELRIQALVQGAQVWAGHALHEGGSPTQLWHDILRCLVLAVSLSDLEAGVLAPFVPGLAELLGRPVPPAPELEGPNTQTRFLATIVTLLRRATQNRPVVLTLEDLHWITPLSLTILLWVARVAPELRLLLVGTYRTDEAAPVTVQLQQHLQLLPLARMSQPQVATLTAAILGQSVADLPQLVRFLYQETEGNAFFLVEVLRTLAEETGMLAQVTQLPQPTRVWAGGVQQMVRRILQRLAPADYAVLEMAAVGGRLLDLNLLRHLAPSLDLPAWLARLAEAAVLTPLEVAWQFAHEQLRQGVLAALPAARLQALHLAYATGIEQLYASQLTPHYDRLVYHYTYAAQPEKQQLYLALAGQAAAAVYANAEAENYLTQALDLLPATALAQRYALLTLREEIRSLLGQRASQAADLLALTQIANALADPLRQSQVALAQANYYISTDQYDKAETAAAQAKTLALACGDDLSHAQLLIHWGRLLCHLGRYTEAQTELEFGLILAHQLQVQPIEIDLLRQLGWAMMWQNHYPEARALMEQSWQLAQRMQDRRREGVGLINLAILNKRLSQYTVALDYYQQALQRAREIGSRYLEALTLNSLGDLYRFLGLYTEAQGCFGQAVKVARESNGQAQLLFVFLNLGHVCRYQGDLPQARQHYTESLKIAEAVGYRSALGYMHTGLGHTCLAEGQPQAAVAQFEMAAALWQSLQQPAQQAEARAGLAWAWLQCQQPAEARAQVELVLAYLATGSVTGAEEPLHIYLLVYRVLRAITDARAAPLLMRARADLQTQALALEPTRRHAFLENVRWHRELLAEPVPATSL